MKSDQEGIRQPGGHGKDISLKITKQIKPVFTCVHLFTDVEGIQQPNLVNISRYLQEGAQRRRPHPSVLLLQNQNGHHDDEERGADDQHDHGRDFTEPSPLVFRFFLLQQGVEAGRVDVLQPEVQVPRSLLLLLRRK
ncbi:hypothetical protein EYF80_036348 [Liparis tanakae]|uniref:Uncharacterized protein n=1 Tax=Liparis tanakae TaxID=230148 RepID=A0A4Z2GIS4_9TELE|nr:hypothetical protein EYF80_036348 [Liparis tanakae]